MTIRASCNFCRWAQVAWGKNGKTVKWVCVVCQAETEIQENVG
jgi:hypothetical protein